MKNLRYVLLLVLVSGCTSTPEFTEEQLKAPFVENRADVENCYQAALKKQPGLEGVVELKFLINDQGKSEKTIFRKKASSITNKGLNLCLKKAVARWQFPKGKKMEIVYPFRFEVKNGTVSNTAVSAENAVQAPKPNDKELVIIQDGAEKTETAPADDSDLMAPDEGDDIMPTPED